MQSRELSKSKSAAENVDKLTTELAQARHQNDGQNEIKLRRMAFTTEKGGNQLTTGDTAKLQFKINDLSRQLEDQKYEKLHLTTKVQDLEKSLSIKASKTAEDELRKKLQAAEQLCEELMDENNEIKKELRGMEEEMDEIQGRYEFLGQEKIERFIQFSSFFIDYFSHASIKMPSLIHVIVSIWKLEELYEKI